MAATHTFRIPATAFTVELPYLFSTFTDTNSHAHANLPSAKGMLTPTSSSHVLSS